MSKLVVKGKFKLQKMDMKGGWTYTVFDYKVSKTGLPFGWLIVKGMIDDYPIKQYKLWPTKEGRLFISIKSEIRKKIKKGDGDTIYLELYEDNSEVEFPEELMSCLLESPRANDFFHSISGTSQKQYIDWIYASKSLETRANRIAKAIEKMEKGLKYHQKEE